MIKYSIKHEDVSYRDYMYPAAPSLQSNPSDDETEPGISLKGTWDESEEKVLVVNDAPDLLELTELLLRQSGYKVLTAHDGRDGLETAQRERPDLIVSDIAMPRMDGIEMCRLIRRDAELGQTPVLLVSAVRKDTNSIVKALMAGADDYLEAPYVPMRLVHKVSQLIERKKAQREMEEAERRYKLVEEKLKESEAQFEEAQRVAHIGSFEWEIEVHKGKWTDELYRIVGLEPRSVHPTEELLSKYLIPKENEAVMQALDKAMRKHEPFMYEHSVERGDGGMRVLQIRGRIVADEIGTPIKIVGTAQDITELKQTEEALRRSEEQFLQSQKMEAIGQLAGGVAHDFNNLLTAIQGYSDLALRQLHFGDPLRRNIEEIKKASDRAASLTRQLLAFSRRQVLQPQVIDINSIIADMTKMLPRLIGENIELRTVFDPALGYIKADPGQIEQVILNLAINARDAMQDGGKLTIETHNIFLDETFASCHLEVAPGPYIMLAVSDTGCGMNEKIQERIFEPFFTTKEQGRGTGLGLSTVYGIVKQSGGTIWVYSEVGRGTVFKIYLPRVDEKAEEAQYETEIEEQPRGAETILLAEDEEMLRNLAREVLELSGYRVLEAANGGAALLLCEQYQGSIHLLLTDVVMPEMSGRALAERLLKIRPEMRVLYMSGYTNDAIVYHGVLDENINYLQKPFTPDALMRKVREVLDK